MVEMLKRLTEICSASCNLWSGIVLIEECSSSWGNFLVGEEQLLCRLQQLWEVHLVLLVWGTSSAEKMNLYHGDDHSQNAWHT